LDDHICNTSRIITEERKYPQADQAIRRASEQASKSEDQAVRLATLIMAGEVHTAIGKSAEASKELQSALVDAAKLGYRGYKFEVRVALGQTEMNSGKPDARAHLEALEIDARRSGFGLIARKAASALAGKPRARNSGTLPVSDLGYRYSLTPPVCPA
jgi:hypothetical protein